MDQSRFIAACTTRRAGKSNGLGLRFYQTLQRHPGARCPYFALTRDSAKNIMWEVLKEQDEKYKIGAKFTDSNLTVTIPKFKDAEIKLFGADMKNFIKRVRGQKWPGVGVDEAQDFGPHLESLIDDVITPATSDYADGWIALTGTPGPVPHGFFYDVTEQKKFGYSLHSWSLFQNPYLPNPAQFVADLKKKKEWSDTHPTLIREYYGRWVLDLEALVFKYQAEKNHYESLPKFKRGWNYVFGVDLGFDDADAIAVLAWNDSSPNVYLVHESIHRGQTVTELTNELLKLIKIYDPMKIVMDTGGLGKKIAKEIQRRTSIGLEPADKERKFEHIELLNDGLRTGRFLAKKDSQFASDATKVKWDYEKSHGDRLVISDSFHSDVCFVAGTMILTDSGEKPIELVKVGDRVLTRAGFRPVTWSGSTGNHETINLIFSNGTNLECTANHPIFSSDLNDFTRADALLYGSRVVISDACQNAMSSYSRGPDTSGIPSLNTSTLDAIITDTSFGEGAPVRKNSCTVRCGNSITARFRRAITSIIRTATRSIIICLTWSASQLLSTTRSTSKTNSNGLTQNAARSTLIAFGRWLTDGIRLQKVGLTLEKMAASLRNAERALSESALCAARLLSKIHSPIGQSTALPNVRLNGGANLASTMLSSHAPFVGVDLPRTDTQNESSAVVLVRRSTRSGKEPVYNITVSGQPEYFANGILVHNCDAVQYSYTEALHWLHEAEPKRPAKGTPEAAALEADEMEEAAEAAMAGGESGDGWGDEWKKFG